MRNGVGIRWSGITRDRWAFGGWVVLGLGLVLLAASILFSVWLIQRSGNERETTTTSASGSPIDTAKFGDYAKLEIRRGAGTGSGDTLAETSGAGEAGVIIAGDGEASDQDLAAEDSANFSDAVTVDVQGVPEADPDETAPAGGAAGGATNVADSAQYVVRDADGNIKEQGVID